MKYLGIDFGSKRVGFAESDEEGKLAFPMMIADNDKSLMRDTLEIIRAMKIGCVVIGESLDGKGKPNEIAKAAREFAVELEDKIDIKIVFEKEWYSSAEARKAPEAANKIDDVAAAIILQRYLDKINPKVFASEEIVEDDSDE
jgi:putative Holliday junction resolvase